MTEPSLKRVRVGCRYVFDPCNLLDRDYAQYTGQAVTVIRAPGLRYSLPPPWAHIRADDGRVMLVNRGSLTPIRKATTSDGAS